MFKEIAVFADVVICLMIMIASVWTWFMYCFLKKDHGITASNFIFRMKQSMNVLLFERTIVPPVVWSAGGFLVGTMSYYETYFAMSMGSIVGIVVVSLIVINDIFYKPVIIKA